MVLTFYPNLAKVYILMLTEKNTEELIVLEAIFSDTLHSIEDSETKYKILITTTDQSGIVI